MDKIWMDAIQCTTNKIIVFNTSSKKLQFRIQAIVGSTCYLKLYIRRWNDQNNIVAIHEFQLLPCNVMFNKSCWITFLRNHFLNKDYFCGFSAKTSVTSSANKRFEHFLLGTDKYNQYYKYPFTNPTIRALP